MSKAKAIFLDRDGVLNRDHGYTYRTEDLEFLPGVIDALHTLKDQGFLLIVITNQSGVARGYYTLDDVTAFHLAMQNQLKLIRHLEIDAFYVCPHHPEGKIPEFAIQCKCRKPGTKLIEDATRDFAIDLSRSFFVGDKYSDIECAVRSGVRGIQIRDHKVEDIHEKALAVAASLEESLASIFSK